MTKTENHCQLSIFGGDCHINNLGCTFAFHKNRMKSTDSYYDIGVDILQGHIAWINNGFPASVWSNNFSFVEGQEPVFQTSASLLYM